MTPLELNMINALVVCVFIFIMFFWTWAKKNKYQKQAVGHILGEFVTKVGTGYDKLLRMEGGLVQIEPDEKRDIRGKAFPVDEKSSFMVDYPEGPWCPRFLKCKIKKMVFREFDVEPVSDLYSGEPVMKPEILYNIRREMVTEIGVRVAQERGKELGIQTTKSKFGGMKFWLLILGLAAAGGIIYMVSTMMQMKSALGM